ncbi:MAG: ABC transporter ATP-binding protein [Candidatus Limnocylindria bacterium]
MASTEHVRGTAQAEGVPAVRADGVSKTYILRREQRRTLKEVVLRQYAPSERVEALREVSFEVQRGEAFGVIGSNGSGKSTLLKLIAGTSKPTSGRLDVHGRVSALLELGAGFHPDFTGRENAYLNGSLLGLSRRRMDAAMPGVESFADLGRFFDAPVKTYSSGMYARLGFAVAVHLDPDVLLVDEVLAVGDEYFQHKCFAKIAELRREERTIVLVSHDLGSVQRLCERAVWLDGGRVAASGTVRDVIAAYQRTVGEREQRERAARGEVGVRWGSKEVEIVSARVLDGKGGDGAVLATGEPASIEVAYRNPGGVADAVFGIYVYRDDGVGVYGTNTLMDGATVPSQAEGRATVRFDALDLLPGAYDVDVGIIDPQDRYYDYLQKGLSFRVIGGTREAGVARLRHRWEFE